MVVLFIPSTRRKAIYKSMLRKGRGLSVRSRVRSSLPSLSVGGVCSVLFGSFILVAATAGKPIFLILFLRELISCLGLTKWVARRLTVASGPLLSYVSGLAYTVDSDVQFSLETDSWNFLQLEEIDIFVY